MLQRRDFLSAAFGLAGSLALRPILFAQLEGAPASLPDHSLFDKNEDAYWAEMRKLFLIPPDEVYLNNGTVGSSPAQPQDTDPGRRTVQAAAINALLLAETRD